MAMTRRQFLAMSALGTVGAGVAARAWAWGPEEVARQHVSDQLCAASGKKPNVILILCDDLGWGDLGAFWQNGRQLAGQTHIETPHLDAAMQQGVMLKAAYTTSPVCAPARASMVTGKNQGHCSLRDNMFDRPIDARMTLGTVMKQAGYDTWHIGKWGIGGGYESGGQPRRSMACDAGFDYSYGYPAHAHGHSFYHWECATWASTKVGSPIVENVSAAAYAAGQYLDLSAGAAGSEAFAQDPEGTYYRRQIANAEVRYCYDTDLFTAKIKQLIDAHTGEKPFFCYACYTTVHGSGSQNSQGDTTLRSVANFHVPGAPYPALDDGDGRWGGGVKWVKDANGYLPFKEGTGEGEANTSNTYIYPAYAGYTTSQQRYATNVQRLDDAMGDLLHFLKVRGLLENTLFIFTSDNGPAGEYVSGYSSRIGWVNGAFKSNGPFNGMKRWVNEGGMREPTFALWPGTIPASGGETPRASDFPFQFPAWMATLADVAGLPQPAACDGVSILPTLTRSGKQLPMRVYGEQQDGEGVRGFAQMVRDGDYVLLRNNGLSGTCQLYNVVEDPAQATNLAGQAEHAERLAAMTNLLITCRLPVAKVPDASGAIAAYAQTSSHAGIEAAALPAIRTAALPAPGWNGKLYRKGAEAWPWVPALRTVVPDGAFTTQGDDEAVEALAKLGTEACGISLRGWFRAPTDGNYTFASSGTGGVHLWIHEVHAIDREKTDEATRTTSITLALKAGFHPLRIYLTQDPTHPRCTLTLGERRI